MPAALPPESEQVLRNSFARAGQAQVFRFWPRLSESERAELVRQASEIDLALLDQLREQVLAGPRSLPRLDELAAVGPDDPGSDAARAAGREMLAAGQVAFMTVAGGQSTRLGFGAPKGLRAVGPISGKSLFHWHAEKVLAASRRYSRAIAWVVMVSETNAATTEQYFADAGFFGLEGQVRFVRQAMLPSVDGEGRILLRSPGRIALSPNGHGGTIKALGEGGALDWLARRGVSWLSYFQVDNALLNPADPAFLGTHRLKGAEMSAKVVEKRDAFEKAGILAYLDGKPGVVEYSELPEDLATEKGPDGKLRYRLASIAAHVFSRGFLERMQGHPLPFHCAIKSIPTVDEDGHPVEVWGRKFETFIFDAIPEARSFMAFLTTREEEFAPLKNATGPDSPETVREALLERTRRWYRAVGRVVPDAEECLELSPLAAYDLESFREYVGMAAAGGEP